MTAHEDSYGSMRLPNARVPMLITASVLSAIGSAMCWALPLSHKGALLGGYYRKSACSFDQIRASLLTIAFPGSRVVLFWRVWSSLQSRK